MIKGVNRKVIEINHPDSIYFERAVLYLRPEVTEASLHDAQAETEAYFGQLQDGKNHKRLRGWVLFLLGALTSAGIFACVSWLIL